jgi:methionyl-tRNA synthetase
VGYFASFRDYVEKQKTLGRAIDEDAFLDAAAAQAAGTEMIHFIGKDILYFHALFWPAMLENSGYRTPTQINAHGFLTVDGAKMSKSRGTFITAQSYLEQGLNPEWLRYYFAAKLNGSMEDIDLNLDDFCARVNADLVGKYVNIASRCAGFISQRFDGKLGATDADAGAEFAAAQRAGDIAEAYEKRDFGRALREIMRLADVANQYIAANKPWELAKQEGQDARLHVLCSTALGMFRELTLYQKPILPRLAAQVEAFLNIAPLQWGAAAPAPGHKINPYRHLMTRVDPKQIAALVAANPESLAPAPAKAAASASPPVSAAAENNYVSIDDFAKIDLRVARIVAAEQVEGADKLLKLTLDLGDQRRQVFAGIKSAYRPEQLLDRLTVMVANLQPRKMKFGMSEGMVLAAGPGGKDIFLLTPDSGALPGMQVK